MEWCFGVTGEGVQVNFLSQELSKAVDRLSRPRILERLREIRPIETILT